MRRLRPPFTFIQWPKKHTPVYRDGGAVEYNSLFSHFVSSEHIFISIETDSMKKNQNTHKINNIKRSVVAPNQMQTLQKSTKIEILAEQASCKREKKQARTETGKFARLNECNNKITLSQIRFFVRLWSLIFAIKLPVQVHCVLRYSTDDSYIFSQRSASASGTQRERVCTLFIRKWYNLCISRPE